MTALIQSTLFPRTAFPHPTAAGLGHYVPVLKTLPGEMRALTNLSASTQGRLTPCIEVSARAGDSDEALRNSILPNLPKRLASTIGSRPFFLDFPWLPTSKRISVIQGGIQRETAALEYVTNFSDSLGLNFIPVVTPGSDPRRLALTREIADGTRGACIRMPVSRAIPEMAVEDEIDRILNDVQVDPGVCDLLVDLEYLDPDPGYDSADLARILNELPFVGNWRSLVVVGTVVPPSLSKFDEGTITAVPRLEWTFWNEIRANRNGRPPIFGDYGIQNPRRPSSRGWRMKANIRYSTPEALFIARGRSLKDFGADEYRMLCQALVQHPAFCDNEGSWGDEEIRLCAEGFAPPGSQIKWRGAGTSHHLEVMVRALSTLAASSAA